MIIKILSYRKELKMQEQSQEPRWRETEEEFLIACKENPDIMKEWLSFKEGKKAVNLFHEMGIFTDKELKDYCEGTASEDLVEQIEKDQECKKWVEEKNSPLSEEEEIRVQRILEKVYGKKAKTLFFTWDDNGEEVIQDNEGNVLLKTNANESPQEIQAIPKIAMGPEEKKQQKNIGYWEYPLSPQGKIAVIAKKDGLFYISFQNLKKQGMPLEILLTGKTENDQLYYKKLRCLSIGCVFTNIPAGKYEISLENQPCSIPVVHLLSKPNR